MQIEFMKLNKRKKTQRDENSLITKRCAFFVMKVTTNVIRITQSVVQRVIGAVLKIIVVFCAIQCRLKWKFFPCNNYFTCKGLARIYQLVSDWLWDG